MIRPPRLRAGDRVALIAPAGPVSPQRIRAALQRCEELGLEAVLGRSARARKGYLAGDDTRRLADFEDAVADAGVAAVWALRGGYGTMRILPRLPLEELARRPKAFIGFSDNTAVHLALSRLGVVSFHGPHAGVTDFPPTTERAFRSVLFAAEAAGVLPAAEHGPPPAPLVDGIAEGVLTGGNLALLAATCGTPWALRCRGAILVVEEVGEPVYRIDRMLSQLALSGCFGGIAGLAIGRISEVQGETRDLRQLLAERAAELGVPAVVDLPFGHVSENWTLPLGVRARLDAGAGTLELLEPAVA
jgi:muramoyltetrapeptide carboxypeptidase